ncbi:cupin domain-containing protein [Methylobacter sp. Wu8]|uniref:Quercetin dioxygenase-like cupin family protein n=1 Tax=Methylobacter tundripaludum TaxID=173365 RepID=A0A2S6H4Q3_9GAMM|nr:cupin domain-containing protein [Methylobacter tundripaludum]MCK9636013.1 cupin domain-containing protein [Methylobacter tundripaludum]PPK72400.1 quercetin dioxygenase-like cupin family protein [Methylobacter tundripaludum]
MNLKTQLILLLTLCCPLAASALDENPTIKVTQLLKTTTSWDGKQIIYPKGQGEVTALTVEIAPEGETGWHEHPVPSFGYIMEGELELRLATGEVKFLHAGDVLPESVGVLHNGRNTGEEPLKILVFYTGEVGAKLSVAHPEFVPPATPDSEK